MSNTQKLNLNYQHRFYLDEQDTDECRLWMSANNVDWQRGMFGGIVYRKGTKNVHLGYFLIGDDSIYKQIASRWQII